MNECTTLSSENSDNPQALLVLSFLRWHGRFLRGMSSVLTEQLLRDIGDHRLDSDGRKLAYCLRRRGWLLLNLIASSDLKVTLATGSVSYFY